MSRVVGYTLLACVLFVGCGDDDSTTEDTGMGDSGLDTSVDTMVEDPCGNGVVDEGEECDGADLDGQSCTDLDFLGGTLGCDDTCRFDKSACEAEECGNGVVDSGEACDGGDLAGATCASLGFTTGRLTCSAACELITAECEACGNGTVDESEECDGADLGSATCVSRGFTGGTLACDASCGYDEVACVNELCGNGVVDDGEDCDGAELGGGTCAASGFATGTIACNADCAFDTSACTSCGDGVVNGDDACDGSDFGERTCATEEFTSGDLGCSATCEIDTSACVLAVCGNRMIDSGETCDDGGIESGDGCSATCQTEDGYECDGTDCSPVCGDGMIVGGEACDGDDLGGNTCVSQGFDSGTLSCGGRCRLNTSACITVGCGNGILEGDENCDDGNTDAFDGCDATCMVEPTFDLPVRTRNGAGSNEGMVEVQFEGEWRDICDDNLSTSTTGLANRFADIVCETLGFHGTGHTVYTAGGGTDTPLMDDVACGDRARSLTECEFAGWNRENCFASEAVGVRCVPAEGDSRLVDGPSGMEGRLQVFHDGEWGEVCDDIIQLETRSRDGSYSAAATVCHQLGYKGGEFLSTYDAPSGEFLLDNVECGREARIIDCPHNDFGVENCSATEGAGFRCETWGEGDIRFRNAQDPGSPRGVLGSSTLRRHVGRLEVLHDGVWGSICNDGIWPTGASTEPFINTACNQLGFTTGTGNVANMWDGPMSQPIWLDDVQCDAADTTVPMCENAGWGVNDCSHVEDLTLSCD